VRKIVTNSEQLQLQHVTDILRSFVNLGEALRNIYIYITILKLINYSPNTFPLKQCKEI
jgi:hypothetical protein